MRALIFLLGLIISLGASGQDYVKKADQKYRNKRMEEAKELYHKSYLENPHNYKILKGLVLTNQQLGQTEEAEKWMRQIINQGKELSTDLYLFSEILKINDKFQEAEMWFNKYAVLYPFDKKTKEGKSYFERLKTLKKTSSFIIEPLSFNTSNSEMGAFVFNNGIIYSTGEIQSKKSGAKSNLDLWFAEKKDGQNFSTPHPFAEKIHTPFNDGPVAYDPQKKQLYVTRYAPHKAQFEEGELFYHMQIIVASEKDGKWQFDTNFFFNSPGHTTAHPSISSDGNLLFFASDINGGYGGSDIYFCYKKEGEWSEPYNLGPGINTDGNEFFPFIADDRTLYFSSDGHPGVGGYDIFYATPSKGIYKTSKNLGLGINSAKDDVSIFVDESGMKGYVSSNRTGGKGLYDIYYFENQNVPIIISGEIKEKVSGKYLPGISVEIKTSEGETIFSSVTDEKGQFMFETFKQKNLIFSAGSKNYETLKKTLDVEPLNKNDKLVLKVSLNKK